MSFIFTKIYSGSNPLKRLVFIFMGVSFAFITLYFIFTSLYAYKEKQTISAKNHNNAEYLIEGEKVRLVGGVSEASYDTETSSKIVTRYFGNELVTDLDGDGDEDVAFVLTQTSGGTGTFYYAVAGIKTEEGYVGSDGYLLGDRIAPQSTTISPNPRHRNVVVFNYADRSIDEAMSVSPSFGRSVYLKIVPESNRWAIVEPDFEGESRF